MPQINFCVCIRFSVFYRSLHLEKKIEYLDLFELDSAVLTDKKEKQLSADFYFSFDIMKCSIEIYKEIVARIVGIQILLV